MINGDEFFGVPRFVPAVRWLPPTTPHEQVYIAAAKRQHERAVEFQEQGADLAELLGVEYSIKWLSSRLITLGYDSARRILRGHIHMNLEHIVDFTQAVSPPAGTVEAVVENESK